MRGQGGGLLERVSGDDEGGAAGLLDGLWFPVAPPAGWTSHLNGKFDAPDCTTPAKTTSWGRIKTMYR